MVYGSEVLSNCRIKALGSNEGDSILTVDFGQGPCSSGQTVVLQAGSITVNGIEIVSYSAAYKDIIFVMSNCEDEVTILGTYADASSVEVLGNAGNDRIVIGGDSRPLDANMFCNIIVDGGTGRNVLVIRDQDSVESKSVEVHSTMLTGLHGSGDEAFFYFDIEEIDMALGNEDMQVDVFSTTKNAQLILTTGGKSYSLRILRYSAHYVLLTLSTCH